MRNKSTVGIHISENRIWLTLLSQTDKGIELIKAASAALPSGAESTPNLISKTVSELCGRNKIPTDNAVISLSAKPSILRVMNIPPNISGSPSQYVRNELKHCAAMSAKAMANDVCLLSPMKNTTGARAVIAAADGQKIAEIVTAFARVGINVKAVEPSVLAVVRLLHKYIAGKFDSNILIAVVEDSAVSLCVFQNAALDLVHTVQIGENDLEQDQNSTALLTEIGTIIQFYDIEIDESPKKWELLLVLPQEDKKYDTLLKNLQNAWGDDKVRLCTEKTIFEDCPRLSGKEKLPASPISTALAMRDYQANAGGICVNLLPKNALSAHNLKKFLLTTSAAVFVVFLISMLAVPFLAMRIKSVNDKIASYRQARLSENITQFMEEESAIELRNAQIKEKIDAITSICLKNPSNNWAGLLQEIKIKIPEHLRLTRLGSSDNKTLFIDGQAFSFDQVNMFAEQLEKSPLISSVKVVKSEFDPAAQNLLSYTLHCSFAKGKGEPNAD